MSKTDSYKLVPLVDVEEASSHERPEKDVTCNCCEGCYLKFLRTVACTFWKCIKCKTR